MKEKFVVIENKNLNEYWLKKIAKLKEQHWNYSIESQQKWIRTQLTDKDIHLLLLKSNNIVSYLSIVDVELKIGNETIAAKGIGSVCVSTEFQGLGYGKKILSEANDIIIKERSVGVLLCKKNLTSFYKKCGWKLINCEQIIVAGMKFEHALMIYNSNITEIEILSVSRNF